MMVLAETKYNNQSSLLDSISPTENGGDAVYMNAFLLHLKHIFKASCVYECVKLCVYVYLYNNIYDVYTYIKLKDFLKIFMVCIITFKSYNLSSEQYF